MSMKGFNTLFILLLLPLILFYYFPLHFNTFSSLHKHVGAGNNPSNDPDAPPELGPQVNTTGSTCMVFSIIHTRSNWGFLAVTDGKCDEFHMPKSNLQRSNRRDMCLFLFSNRHPQSSPSSCHNLECRMWPKSLFQSLSQDSTSL
ncbi:hypothetical protein BT67DRAFT_287677 [Trichocladium antarcticum]|uniref:Uncharacterized protein n=1 Tax=Trichocladium antarcticum TaxID=1450529 RepID=A0AAN6UL11_9PEZI|nr:hypothetical protein BT67DRAFT_287677 [Trichocladium antarcticum]